MLKEIFEKIASEMENHLLLKGMAVKVKPGQPAENSHSAVIYIEMMHFGPVSNHKRRLPQAETFDPSGGRLPYQFSFFALPVVNSYTTCLQLSEAIAEFFEVKPFFQLVADKEEYELAITMPSVTTADYLQFWTARRQTPQPVLFFDARVSSM